MTTNSEKFFKHVLTLMLGAAIISWFVYSIYGISIEYSYWQDELFSVVASSMSLTQQIDIYLNDVHPPLYQILLSFWEQFLGTSEAATRSLSAVFVISSLPALFVLNKKINAQLGFLITVIFFSNWLVYFYAQEARSYGLLLMLSTWSFTLFARNEKTFILPCLILLGFTHFFGTLQALLYIAWLVIENHKKRVFFAQAIATALLIATWPIIYLLSGNGAEMVGGNFWIKSTPADAINQSIQVGFPALHASIGKIASIFGPSSAFKIFLWACTMPVVLVLFGFGFKSLDQSSQKVALKAVYLTAVTTIAVAIINIHTPISTTRNFIVIIPSSSLLIAIVAWGLCNIKFKKISALLVFVTIFVISQYQTYKVMSVKFAPNEDWKSVAHLAEDLAAENELEIFAYIRETFHASDISYALAAYYFSDTSSIGFVTTDNVANLHSGSIIVFGHIPNTADTEGNCYNKILKMLDDANRKYSVFFAEQPSICKNGYIRLEWNE